MSVYNFNDRDDETNEVRSGYNHRSNGTVGYHQMESDFLNRSMANSSSQAENSVQLTRPTSKTALLVRQRRAMLEQLSCFICKGYLIDATTLDECMDSFCKSCIVLHLRTHSTCPKCHVFIGQDNPLSAMRPDKVLQDIVYKLIPGLYDDEMKRRRDFYREFYGAAQQSASDDEADSNSSSGTLTVQGTSLSGERYGVILHPKPFYKPTDSIDLSIEPQTRGDNTTIYYDNHRQSIVTCFTGSLQQRDLNNDSGPVFSSVDSQLFKTYLRCPAKFTILQLKKFIAAKFNICRDDTIHLLYLNELLLDEYSLMDVAYIYDWRGIEHMQLFYKIERDLVKVNTADQHQDNHSRAGKVTRQSVGISTQTVKRVCIDPEPKFYEEKNNNEIGVRVEGRSMRPRTTETQTMNGTRPVPANPIIRTSVTSPANKTFSIQINGTSTREQVSGQGRSNSRHVIERTPTSTVNHGIQKPMSGETRSLRSQVANAIKTISSPDTQISHSKANISSGVQTQSLFGGGNVAQDRVKNLASASQDSPIGQLVPYAGNGFVSSPAKATQSSIVTLASFIEAKARNNTITSVSSTSASVQTLINDPNVTGIGGSSAPFKQRPDYTSTLRMTAAPKVPGTPQLAFSYVTERGITIVRRLNNHEAAAQSLSSVPTNTANQTVPSRPQAETNSADSATRSHSATITDRSGGHVQHAQTSTSNLNLISSQSVSQSSSSQRANEEAVSSRHNLKAKPVYKLFPDPTKLKSPNLKKLGFTARH